MLDGMHDWLPIINLSATAFGLVAICIVGLMYAKKQSVVALQLEQQQMAREINTAFTVIKQLEQTLNDHRHELTQQQHQIEKLAISNVVFAEKITKIQVQTQVIEERDPQVKLYAKASMLVADGASIDEVMSACDLGRAEVELLQNIHSSG